MKKKASRSLVKKSKKHDIISELVESDVDEIPSEVVETVIKTAFTDEAKTGVGATENTDKPAKIRKKSKASERVHYVNSKEFEERIRVYYNSGKIADDLAESINKIAHGLSFAPNFINYCPTKSAEALTQRGWLKYDEINEQDIILSYNIKTKQLTWGKIKSIYRGNYEGKLFKVQTKGISTLVTPGHKFVIRKEGHPDKCTPVEHIQKHDHIVINGLPVIDPQHVVYSNDFVELMGWAVTEGNYLLGKNTHSVQIFQKEGKKAQRIRDLLKRLNIEYREYNWTKPEIKGFRFRGDMANQIIADAPERILSYDFILSLDQEQRELIIQTMIDGDGSSRTRNDKTRSKYLRHFGQKDKRSIDAFLMICTLAGITTHTIKIKNQSDWSNKDFWKCYLYSNPKLTVYGTSIHLSIDRKNIKVGQSKENNPNIPTEFYNGIVWCPETEYGTWVCRDNGYIFVTSNSYKDDMVGDAIVKMFSALKNKKFRLDSGFSPFSYFTTIAFHAFINRIKKEKKYHEAVNEYKEKVYIDTMQAYDGMGGSVYIEPHRDADDPHDTQYE